MNQISKNQFDQKEPAASAIDGASLDTNMDAVDERIKYWMSLEMKKVSQMLIQNLTVFVQ